MRQRIAIDLGSQNTAIWTNGGIATYEPTILAISSTNDRVIAAGANAREMLGRTPDSLQAVSPVKQGVVSDVSVSSAFLKIQIAKFTKQFQILRPDIMITVPSGSTSVER